MKTHHSILLISAVISIATAGHSQPAFTAKPDAVQQRTLATWEQVQQTAQLYQALPRFAPDPVFLASYEPTFQRLRYIADRYAAIDLRGADESLRQHVKAQIDAHKVMSQAFRLAQTEFVPALQATLPELLRSPRAVALAKNHGFDLASASVTEESLGFIAVLAADKAFASESRWLAKQASLIAKAADSFQQAEERLRAAHASHASIANTLAVKYGGAFASSRSISSLWAW